MDSPRDGIPLSDDTVDIVIMNPPFGTKHNQGFDVQFLATATRLARKSVYSFHKRSTRKFLLRTIQQDWQYSEAKVVAEMEFDIPQMYKFHQESSKSIEVDLIRIDTSSRTERIQSQPVGRPLSLLREGQTINDDRTN